MPPATQRIEGIARSVAGGRQKIGLDTNCVKYYLNSPPVQPWADCLDPIIQAGLSGSAELYISTVVVSEILSHAHFTNRHNAGFDPDLHVMAILSRNFEILDVDRDVAKAAGRLRGVTVPGDKISLKTPDALIAGTSIANGHTILVTNDLQLANALPPNNCIYLKEAALEWLGMNFPSICYADPTPVRQSGRGPGLPNGAAIARYELGAVHPDPGAKWERILAHAFTAAAALNEPCLFFVLTAPNGRRVETREVLLWHEGLETIRPIKKVIRRLWDHLGYSPRTGVRNADHQIYIFCFASISRERARQAHPSLASRGAHQKEADAFDAYLKPFWSFREVLQRTQTTCLLCEDGLAHRLDNQLALQFLERAKNVLGWHEDQ